MSTKSNRWDALIDRIERIPPAQLDALIALYRELCDQQQTDLPLLPEKPDETLDELTRTVDRYTDRIGALLQTIDTLPPIPTDLYCPEHGL